MGHRVASDVLVSREPVAYLVLQPGEAVGVRWPGEVPYCGGEGGCAGFGTGCEETTSRQSDQPENIL